MKRLAIVAGLILWFGVLSACVPQTAEEPEATQELLVPTAVLQVGSSDEELPVAAFTPLPAVPTFVVPTRTPSSVTDESVTLPPEGQPRYHVAFVLPDDVLNVRTGPGVEFDVAGEFAPDLAEIEITGSGQVVEDSTWVPVTNGETSGWVNGRFLTRSVNELRFCQDNSVQDLLEDFKSAVASGDGSGLSQLVHPERGVKVRLSWWNPEILIRGDEVTGLFTSDNVHEWGIEDGSGNEITGTFAEIALPMLEDDLLGAVETGCNEIVHDGTAGWVRLPDGYEEINFFSYHRPGTEEISGLNWGTWVIGVEKWQDTYFVSFLVHFQWEI